MSEMTAERKADILAQYEEDLLNGEVFARHARSAASVIGYQPPANKGGLGFLVEIIGKMMVESPALAQLGLAILNEGALSQGFTAHQNVANVYRAASKAVEAGWFDVVTKASPEPGRPSDWDKQYTLGEVLRAAAWLQLATSKLALNGTALGWVASEIAESNGVSLRLPLPIEQRFGV